MSRPLLVLVLTLLTTIAWSRTIPMDVRLAETRTEQTEKCLPVIALQLINATLPVLAGESTDDASASQSLSLTNRSVYTYRIGRFITRLTDSMASGLSFCAAFGRTCTRVGPEWTKRRYPLSESVYMTHCNAVLGASEEATLFTQTAVPAFMNEIYRCLRVGMKVPPASETTGV